MATPALIHPQLTAYATRVLADLIPGFVLDGDAVVRTRTTIEDDGNVGLAVRLTASTAPGGPVRDLSVTLDYSDLTAVLAAIFDIELDPDGTEPVEIEPDIEPQEQADSPAPRRASRKKPEPVAEPEPVADDQPAVAPGDDEF